MLNLFQEFLRISIVADSTSNLLLFGFRQFEVNYANVDKHGGVISARELTLRPFAAETLIPSVNANVGGEIVLLSKGCATSRTTERFLVSVNEQMFVEILFGLERFRADE